jgi:hypothetical protein
VRSSLVEKMTTCYRKGPVETIRQETPALQVVEFFGYPHTDEATDDTVIDMHFITVGVHPAEPGQTLGEALTEFAAEVAMYPDQERLAGGPSYIEVGGALESQEIALRWMALGKALGVWGILTPESLGFRGEDAAELAGAGMVMISPKGAAG